jgi:hypothetical protein
MVFGFDSEKQNNFFCANCLHSFDKEPNFSQAIGDEWFCSPACGNESYDIGKSWGSRGSE